MKFPFLSWILVSFSVPPSHHFTPEAERVSQALGQLKFEHLKRMETLSNIIHHLTICTVLKEKKRFGQFRWDFQYFHVCPLPLVPSVDTTEKSLVSSSLHLLPKVTQCWAYHQNNKLFLSISWLTMCNFLTFSTVTFKMHLVLDFKLQYIHWYVNLYV